VRFYINREIKPADESALARKPSVGLLLDPPSDSTTRMALQSYGAENVVTVV